MVDMEIALCQYEGVRGLLTRVEIRFGFPVMGQSLRFPARVSMTGKLFFPPNRACPIANAANRRDNQRLAVETGQLGCSLNAGVTGLICGPCARIVEPLGTTRRQHSRNTQEPNPSFWDCLATVNHAGVTARGFRLVKVEPRDSKKLRTCPKETTIQATEIPPGSLYATD